MPVRTAIVQTAVLAGRAVLIGGLAAVALAAPADARTGEGDGPVAPIEDPAPVEIESTDAEVLAAAPEWALPVDAEPSTSLRAVDCGLPFRIGPPIYGWGRWYQICYDENLRYFIRRWW